MPPATIACVFAISVTCCAAADPPAALTPAGVIPLEGVAGRIDHMAVDPVGGRLFLAALGNNTVEIIDTNARKQVGRITGLRKPQGVAFLPDSGRLVVASGDDGKVRVYDRQLKPLGQVDDLDDADNVRYDAEAKLVYVGYGDGALAVIDPLAPRKLADIKLSAHPESFQLEAGGKRIFVNVPDAEHVAVVDREKRSVIDKWPIETAAANFPMALDEPHHRLFIGCRKPAKLLALDTDTGKRVTSLDCCGDADDLFYDAALRRIYVSGGEGCVSVIEQQDPGTYRTAGTLPTAPGARTSLFVPRTGSLYLAVPRRGDQRCELRIFITRQ
jgi:YVTN family beta-propeller protein